MAASFKGGVVLGADTRTSTGAYVANRVTNKLTQLAEKVRLVPEPFLCTVMAFIVTRRAEKLGETGLEGMLMHTIARVSS